MAVLPVGIGPVSAGGYQIERSLRFNSADSAYLNRTFSTPTSNYIWTWSAWIKRSTLGTDQTLFGVAAGNSGNTGFTPRGSISWDAADTLSIFANDGSTTFLNIVTTPVFRDASAWYHVMFVLDTTQATNTNRVKIYINGVQQTVTGTYPNQNVNTIFNGTSASKYHSLGMYANLSQFANGYMTEVNFIDGQALTPSDFGETDSATGVWKPKKFSGTYGTNGFYINFSDSSNTTSTTLGKDSSGNGNNWTPNNFSVTAGADNDSLVDTPTSYGTDTGVGGEVRGNYATLNPNDKNSGITLSNGNLDASMPTQLQNVYGTMSVTSGKWYWETTINSLSGRVIIGVGNTVDQSWNLDPSSSSALWGYYSVNGNKLNGSNTAYGNSFTANDVIGVAVDMDSGKIWFSKNGTWQASGDPAAGTNAAFTNLSGSVRPMYDQQLTNAVTLSCNFGQRPFAYTAPSGYKALCTQNLPTPTIGATSTTQANDYFNPVLYTADTAGGKTISGVGFQPDLVWIKNRDNSEEHYWTDAVRGFGGAGTGKFIKSNSTAAEAALADITFAVNSDGFQITDTNYNSGELYFNGRTYVAWNWKANGAGSSNTDGTITSTVSANTTAGFSIVTYTGNGTNGSTIGHGLGVAPSMIIVKSRSAADGWPVYHTSIANTQSLRLNTTAAVVTAGFWNNTTAGSSVFTVGGGSVSETNTTSATYVAYCFAPVAGYSAFGSYTGNGSTDGPFVYTGFRPRYVMIKASSTGGAGYDWFIHDTARDTYNVCTLDLEANLSSSENQYGAEQDILSNGFKLRNTGGGTNGSGVTYIYAAFAESPFKYSLAR